MMTFAIGSSLTDITGAQSRDSKTKAANESLADSFGEWMKMSPAERIRAQYLSEQGLSEDDLAAMEPEERKAIEDDIATRVKQQLGMTTEKSDQPETAPPQAATNLNTMLANLALS
jgi:TPP-dependent pyruvate/acetoin dehydrogenase alpha subunit